jgi:hypothetical protein
MSGRADTAGQYSPDASSMSATYYMLCSNRYTFPVRRCLSNKPCLT